MLLAAGCGRLGDDLASRGDESSSMSTAFETTGRQPRLKTPTLTAVLTAIAMSLWLVLIPLELIS